LENHLANYGGVTKQSIKGYDAEDKEFFMAIFPSPQHSLADVRDYINDKCSMSKISINFFHNSSQIEQNQEARFPAISEFKFKIHRMQ